MLFPVIPGNDKSKGSLSWMLAHLCVGSQHKQLEGCPQAMQPRTKGTLPSLWPCEAEKEFSMTFPTSVIQRSVSKIPPWTHSWEGKGISLFTDQVPRSVFMQPLLWEQCLMLLTKSPSSPSGRAPSSSKFLQLPATWTWSYPWFVQHTQFSCSYSLQTSDFMHGSCFGTVVSKSSHHITKLFSSEQVAPVFIHLRNHQHHKSREGNLIVAISELTS